MVPELQGYAFIFSSAHRLFHRALERITHDQALERSQGGNPILWIAGHIVTVRSGFLKSIGGSVEVPWAKHFPRGGEVKNEAEWPSLEEVRAKWDEVHTVFMVRLEAVTSAELSAPSKVPGLNDTLLAELGIAALHDFYHIGQLGAARRRFGLDRMVG